MEERRTAEPSQSVSPGVKKKPVLTHHISSFGVLNRNGLEIPSGIEAEPVEREEETKRAEFIAWSMPEQRPGFIQARKHDFF